jgi:hypothetical protein
MRTSWAYTRGSDRDVFLDNARVYLFLSLELTDIRQQSAVICSTLLQLSLRIIQTVLFLMCLDGLLLEVLLKASDSLFEILSRAYKLGQRPSSFTVSYLTVDVLNCVLDLCLLCLVPDDLLLETIDLLIDVAELGTKLIELLVADSELVVFGHLGFIVDVFLCDRCVDFGYTTLELVGMRLFALERVEPFLLRLQLSNTLLADALDVVKGLRVPKRTLRTRVEAIR